MICDPLAVKVEGSEQKSRRIMQDIRNALATFFPHEV